jgi:predicted transcriptional regulator of viral defense system
MDSSAELLKFVKSKGVVRAAELMPYVSARAQLRRYADAGTLIALVSGIYAHPGLDPFIASVLAVARFYPSAVISNVTALVIHELADERVDHIDVDIARSQSIRNKLIRAHRVAKENIIGVTRHVFHQHQIKIYSPERSLCDAYRIDPEGPLFLKAIKRYVKGKKIDPDRVAEFDRILRTNVLRSLTQELANE